MCLSVLLCVCQQAWIQGGALVAAAPRGMNRKKKKKKRERQKKERKKRKDMGLNRSIVMQTALKLNECTTNLYTFRQ